MGASNSASASGWNGNTQSRGNSIFPAEFLQMQNSLQIGKRQFLLDAIDSIIFDDDAFKKMPNVFFSNEIYAFLYLQ